MNEIAYHYFAEVVRQGSIRQAAEVLHVSASSISRQIARLEYEFGAPLLTRHPQGIKLTPAGEMVGQFVRGRTREWQRLKAAIDAIAHLESGHVTVCTVEGMLGGFLPLVISEFAKAHPGITYDVVVRGTDDVMLAVAEDKCDIGISFHPYPRANVTTMAEIHQPLLAVMAPTHRLARRRRLKLSELAGEPVGLPDRNFGIRHLVTQAVKQEQVELQVRLETNSIDMTRQFALYAMGITFLPAFSFEREIAAGTLVGVEVENEALASARAHVCVHAEIEPTLAASRFLEAIRARIRTM